MHMSCSLFALFLFSAKKRYVSRSLSVTSFLVNNKWCRCSLRATKTHKRTIFFETRKRERVLFFSVVRLVISDLVIVVPQQHAGGG